jgi:phosphopantetheine adenylyltransferase
LVSKLLDSYLIKPKDIISIVPESEMEIKDILKNKSKVIKEITQDIEVVIHKLSTQLLEKYESKYIQDIEHQKHRISELLEQSFEKINNSNDDLLKHELSRQMSKIKETNFSISMVEGIVFVYNDAIYKMTGNFSPINQIVGKARKIPMILEEEKIMIENNGCTRKVVLIPGAFKPPHKGHLALLQTTLKRVGDMGAMDKIVVLISPLSRLLPNRKGQITFEQSEQLWKLYLDSVGLTSQVEIMEATQNSPIGTIYDFIGSKSPFCQPGDCVFIGMCEKDEDLHSLTKDNLALYGDKRINVNIIVSKPLSEETGPLSSTGMREAIANNDMQSLAKYLPNTMADSADKVFALVFKNKGLDETKLKKAKKEH